MDALLVRIENACNNDDELRSILDAVSTPDSPYPENLRGLAELRITQYMADNARTRMAVEAQTLSDATVDH